MLHKENFLELFRIHYNNVYDLHRVHNMIFSRSRNLRSDISERHTLGRHPSPFKNDTVL